jgi:hypothetical protein
MKVKISFLLIALLAMGVMSIGVIGCGGDEEPEKAEAKPTTPKPGGEGEIAGSNIDFAAEKAGVLDTWAQFMQAYNDRKMTTVKKLWTVKSSDYLFINISDNERIQASGGNGVQDTLLKLTKGHHSTANDKWNGGNMTEVWIRKKGGQLQASAHGPNALRQGQSWVYFVNDRSTWKISKVESIETRNLAKHLKIEIHEKEGLPGGGFFDDEKHLVP